jgi:hypothetical protein
MEGIILGTVVLWVLSAVLVVPLANLGVARRMAAAGVASRPFAELSDAEKAEWRRVATQQYILWDTLVLGVAGLIGGLLGYYFIGISTQAKGWPGMLAFIAASFLGLGMRGGA